MRNWLGSNWFKISALLIVIISVLLYFWAWRIEFLSKISANTQRESDLNFCLVLADRSYRQLWEQNGTKLGETHFVSDNTRDWLEKKLVDEKDDCFKQYPLPK